MPNVALSPVCKHHFFKPSLASLERVGEGIKRDLGFLLEKGKLDPDNYREKVAHVDRELTLLTKYQTIVVERNFRAIFCTLLLSLVYTASRLSCPRSLGGRLDPFSCSGMQDVVVLSLALVIFTGLLGNSEIHHVDYQRRARSLTQFAKTIHHQTASCVF